MSFEERLRAVMAAPLERIVAPDQRIRPPATVVEQWEVSEKDRFALAEWGLPPGPIMKPEFQDAIEPLLVPNVAGENERRLIAADQRLYQLGWWGNHDLTPKMGAVAGDGRVLAIRDAPRTAADYPAILREHYGDAYFYKPAVEFINSSVAQLIELAWRWHSAVPIFRDLVFEEEPRYYDPETFAAYEARGEAYEGIVLAAMAAIDPAIDADDPDGFWVELITDY